MIVNAAIAALALFGALVIGFVFGFYLLIRKLTAHDGIVFTETETSCGHHDVEASEAGNTQFVSIRILRVKITIRRAAAMQIATDLAHLLKKDLLHGNDKGDNAG